MDFAKILAKLDSFESKQNLNEGWDDMMKASKEKSKEKEKEKGTGKFDKKETSTGTTYTRKSSTFDDGGEDKDVKKAKKKDKEAKKEVGESIASILKTLDAIAESEKKPDDDGDGVPDWADKKPGKDDNEDDDKDDNEDDDKEKVDESKVDEQEVGEGPEVLKLKADQAKAKGEKSFKVGNKTFPVKESDDDVDEGIEDRLKDLDPKNPVNIPAYQRKAKSGDSAAAAKANMPQKSIQECYDQAMSQDDSGMNISSAMDTKTGSKSLTVSARGQAAEELAQILKLSGLVGGSAHAEGPEVHVVAQEEYANEPKPMVQGIDVQMQQGNDLNRMKGTYPKVAGGDNPMQAMMEDKELMVLEARLMKELESIKVKK
jgi:hypothetical protein